MNEIKLTAGVKFTDEYIEAQNKLLEFAEAFNKLTPSQKQYFVDELLSNANDAVLIQQFANFINRRRCR